VNGGRERDRDRDWRRSGTASGSSSRRRLDIARSAVVDCHSPGSNGPNKTLPCRQRDRRRSTRGSGSRLPPIDSLRAEPKFAVGVRAASQRQAGQSPPPSGGPMRGASARRDFDGSGNPAGRSSSASRAANGWKDRAVLGQRRREIQFTHGVGSTGLDGQGAFSSRSRRGAAPNSTRGGDQKSEGRGQRARSSRGKPGGVLVLRLARDIRGEGPAGRTGG